MTLSPFNQITLEREIKREREFSDQNRFFPDYSTQYLYGFCFGQGFAVTLGTAIPT